MRPPRTLLGLVLAAVTLAGCANLGKVKTVINVAAATVGLAAAVLSRDPGAIAKNAKGLYDAATA